MEAMYKLWVIVLALAACVLTITQVLVAQSTAIVHQGYAGAAIVAGKVAPGRQQVTIYDLSYPARTKLGVSESVDKQGNFAVTVKPPLLINHRIIAVDENGATSPAMTVAAPPRSPAGPGK